MTKIENPSAFPVHQQDINGLDCTDPGMTLRDWFAGQALAGWLASYDGDAPHPARDEMPSSYAAGIATMSYRMADAMLAERQKGGQS